MDDQVRALGHRLDMFEQRVIAEMHRVARLQLLAFAVIMAVFNTGLLALSLAA